MSENYRTLSLISYKDARNDTFSVVGKKYVRDHPYRKADGMPDRIYPGFTYYRGLEGSEDWRDSTAFTRQSIIVDKDEF